MPRFLEAIGTVMDNFTIIGTKFILTCVELAPSKLALPYFFVLIIENDIKLADKVDPVWPVR